jgi:hypothetical protein
LSGKRGTRALSKKCRGYWYSKKYNNWAVEIYINDIRIFLGYYPTEDMAKAVRKKAEIVYYGKTYR